jgi:hypothetical protein
VFLPSIPLLLQFANEMEVERDHVLGKPKDGDEDENPFAEEEALLAEANREQDAPGEQEALSFEALESAATFDRVLYDGGEFGTQAEVGSAEEQDYLGIPGLLEPDQVSALLKKHQADQASRDGGKSEEKPAPAAHAQRDALRRELNGLVGAWHHRTGQPHGAVHTALRTACGGPATPQATAEQLQERIDTLRSWATSGRRLA